MTVLYIKVFYSDFKINRTLKIKSSSAKQKKKPKIVTYLNITHSIPTGLTITNTSSKRFNVNCFNYSIQTI